MASNVLKLLDSWEQVNHVMEDHIRKLWQPSSHIKILEAGCGQRWPLNLSGIDFHLTGLDIDGDALNIRLEKSKDLQKAVVGDLRKDVLDRESFDVVYCSFVLEHVSGAETALLNFVNWVKPGGIIILRIPDPESVHGFATRVTPHWFHVLYYRLVLKLENAGKPGHGPYPTYYDPVIWRAGMSEFCKKSNLPLVAEYGFSHIIPGRNVVTRLMGIFRFCVSLMSLGHLGHRHNNLLYIIQKPAAQ